MAPLADAAQITMHAATESVSQRHDAGRCAHGGTRQNGTLVGGAGGRATSRVSDSTESSPHDTALLIVTSGDTEATACGRM